VSFLYEKKSKMNIINGAYYQLIDSRVAHIRGISGYHPEDIVFT
jgi:hypothetical protein